MAREDEWVDEERQAAGPCPFCTADAARPVVYGLPTLDAVEQLEGVVEFAGCCVPLDPAAYVCGECGWRWGTPGPT